MAAPVERKQQVVNRSVHFGPVESVRHPDLFVFYGLWNEARGGRAMPVLADFPEVSLNEFRDKVQVFDIIDGGADFRVRESGSVFRVNGIDMTNRLLSTHPNSGVRERLTDALRRVVAEGKPIHTRFESLENFAVYNRIVESCYLPLGAGDTPEQIIGLTVFPA